MFRSWKGDNSVVDRFLKLMTEMMKKKKKKEK